MSATTTNRIGRVLINDEAYTFTAQDIESEVYKQAAMRHSQAVEPVDILFAVIRQGHGPAGLILKDVIRDVIRNSPVQLVTNNPVEYLRKRYRDCLAYQYQPSANGSLGDQKKPVLGDVATSIFNEAERASLEHKHDKVESIDILRALFTTPESIEDIAYFGIDPQKVIAKIDSYLRSRQD